MLLAEILHLEPHGPDTFVAAGPRYPWGGLYGGQIVAQALRAAAATVAEGFQPHSLRAYFMRRGDHAEPVRYEVDRPRDGRSFCTRRVIARQAVGAILSLEASFQVHEETPSVQTVPFEPPPPSPDDLPESTWFDTFSRRFAPGTDETGRVRAWLKVGEQLDDDPLLLACAFAYLSDDLPTDAVVRAHPLGRLPEAELEQRMFTASLDHAIWFHHPFRVDRWHLHDFRCHGFSSSRGLAVGHVFDEAGLHVATVTQEVLLRDRADRRGG